MTTRRDWFAVQCRLVRLPKFRRMSHRAQLALLYTWALAADEEPEAIWPTRKALEDILALNGLEGDAIVDELLFAGWLDTLDDGGLAIHQWDHHQIAATRDAQRAYEARRKLEWRRKSELQKKVSLGTL